jgi:phenylpropionate dioxygenase-like ring-hydroxylating dioxygenase large terminal subunit
LFINFWYPAGEAKEFTDEPIQRRMLGLDFVLFRDSHGVARVLSNTCTHRGGSLSDGKIVGDCVQCPYHGWQFDGEGQCRKIPSQGPQRKIPVRARVDAYPTVERYGLVFAFLGDLPESERPPIMNIEEYGDDGPAEGWAATLQSFEWPFDYKRSMENGIDVAHNEYVHPTHGFSGERDDYEIGELVIKVSEWGVSVRSKEGRLAPPLKDKKMREASGRDEPGVISGGGTGSFGVSSLWTHIHPTPKMFIHQYLFETPVDDSNTRLYLLNLRNFLLGDEDDARMMERNEVVARQDRDVLAGVHPIQTPPTNIYEFFVGPDEPIAKYREFLKDWEARGWRIDIDKVDRERKRVAYAIPSPARREKKGWILQSVPLLPGVVEAKKVQSVPK